MDVFKNIGSKIFVQTLKKAAKKAAPKAVSTAATKTGEHVGKKVGDTIIQMLSKNNTPKKVRFDETVKPGEEIIKNTFEKQYSNNNTKTEKNDTR